MTSTSGKLLALASAAALIGAGVVASTSHATDAQGIWLDLRVQAEASFGVGAWRWLARAAIVATAVAVTLTLVELALGLRRTQATPTFAAVGTSSVREAITEVTRRVALLTRGDRPNVVAALDELVRGAVAVSASDVHMSPTSAGFKLTYRVHGALHDVGLFDISIAPPLTTRVKVLARLDTYVKNTPQDGRLVMTMDGGTIEARVSTLPTEGGERVVLRIVRGSRSVPTLDSLSFSADTLERLKGIIARPQGLFFVAGPVGSGKTTTLYAALQEIARARARTTTLVTLEDPIELELPFATQTQMHTRSGMTFAGTLRSVLRQDPNVLMIGEIRDHETAEIAMQAGLTGHLILTTVHGENAAGPFARLMEMNVEPFALASATAGSMSQRLVRTLCTACRREAEPEKIHIDRFTSQGIVVPPERFYEAVGCDFCEGEGFTGRTPIAEVLMLTPAVRDAITARKTVAEIHDLAVAEGMIPLLRDGLARATRGETSLTEVLRVAG